MQNLADAYDADVDITIEQSRDGFNVVGRDVNSRGEQSCLKQQLMQFDTYEEAYVISALMFHPILSVLYAAGKITPEIIENAKRLVRERRDEVRS